MYEDWVIADMPYACEEPLLLCKAPKWSGLKAGDLVKVEGWESVIGKVAGCITIDTERDKDLMQFICYLADQNPTKKVVSKLKVTEMEYEK